MDLNREYAAHQHALLGAGLAQSAAERTAELTSASRIAGRISTFQHGLGAGAACAWNRTHLGHLADLARRKNTTI